MFDHVFHLSLPPKKHLLYTSYSLVWCSQATWIPLLIVVMGAKQLPAGQLPGDKTKDRWVPGFSHFDLGLGMWELIMQTTKQQTLCKLHMVGVTPVAWWWPKFQGNQWKQSKILKRQRSSMLLVDGACNYKRHWVFRASPTYLCVFFFNGLRSSQFGPSHMISCCQVLVDSYAFCFVPTTCRRSGGRQLTFWWDQDGGNARGETLTIFFPGI